MIYAQAVFASELTSTQKLVALAWAELAAGRTVSASFAEVAKMTSLSRTAVIRQTQALITAGWLTVLESDPYKANVYRLTEPA